MDTFTVRTWGGRYLVNKPQLTCVGEPLKVIIVHTTNTLTERVEKKKTSISTRLLNYDACLKEMNPPGQGWHWPWPTLAWPTLALAWLAWVWSLSGEGECKGWGLGVADAGTGEVDEHCYLLCTGSVGTLISCGLGLGFAGGAYSMH
jgi:hypothetical protein